MAHAYLFKPFDFDRTPLAPIGYTMQCHEKPSNIGTWSNHSIDSWFLGSLINNYGAFCCYVQKTQACRVYDTVQFLHKHVTQPALTEADAMVKAADYLQAALKGKQNWVGDK